MRDVVHVVLVFLFEALAQIFGGNEAGFAVGEVALRFIAKFDEGGVREAKESALAVHIELAVDRVGVARGDAVPAMGEAAMIDDVGDFRGDVEGTDEIAHGAAIGNEWGSSGCSWHFLSLDLGTSGATALVTSIPFGTAKAVP